MTESKSWRTMSSSSAMNNAQKVSLSQQMLVSDPGMEPRDVIEAVKELDQLHREEGWLPDTDDTDNPPPAPAWRHIGSWSPTLGSIEAWKAFRAVLPASATGRPQGVPPLEAFVVSDDGLRIGSHLTREVPTVNARGLHCERFVPGDEHSDVIPYAVDDAVFHHHRIRPGKTVRLRFKMTFTTTDFFGYPLRDDLWMSVFKIHGGKGLGGGNAPIELLWVGGEWRIKVLGSDEDAPTRWTHENGIRIAGRGLGNELLLPKINEPNDFEFIFRMDYEGDGYFQMSQNGVVVHDAAGVIGSNHSPHHDEEDPRHGEGYIQLGTYTGDDPDHEGVYTIVSDIGLWERVG